METDKAILILNTLKEKLKNDLKNTDSINNIMLYISDTDRNALVSSSSKTLMYKFPDA